MRPEIPKHTGSKRTQLELKTQKYDIQNQIKKMRKALKPQESFNSAFWIQNAEIAMHSRRAVSLQTEIAEQDYQEQGLEAEFSQSEKVRRLCEQLNALEAEERLLKEQAELVSTENSYKDEGRSRKRAFIKLFTASKIGLGVTSTGRGRRDTSAQSQFRAECIKVYDSSHPDPQREFLWCPIVKAWVLQDHATAAPLFAYMHGQDVMNSIFGVIKPPELFSPRNGIIISDLVEKKLDKGFMAIVPRLSNHPTPAQIQLWNSLEPKQYKIRILDFRDPDVHKVIRPESGQTWKDLDNTNIEFRSVFRPRARYLYFHYCIQILRHAWKADRSTAEQMKKSLRQDSGAPEARIFRGPSGRARFMHRETEGEDDDDDEEGTDDDDGEEWTDENDDEEWIDENDDEEGTDEDDDEKWGNVDFR